MLLSFDRKLTLTAKLYKVIKNTRGYGAKKRYSILFPQAAVSVAKHNLTDSADRLEVRGAVHSHIQPTGIVTALAYF